MGFFVVVVVVFDFACVFVEVQFLGYKFDLKGSTYTREKTVRLYLFIKIPV